MTSLESARVTLVLRDDFSKTRREASFECSFDPIEDAELIAALEAKWEQARAAIVVDSGDPREIV